LDVAVARQNRKKRQTQHGKTRKNRVLTHASASSCSVVQKYLQKDIAQRSGLAKYERRQRGLTHDRNHKQHDTMTTFTCSYCCRYSPSSCNGKFTVSATSLDEAKKLARQHLMDNGGIEGISYLVSKI